MARHRPAAEGGYQRGEETRARIIEAAIGVFGEQGYEGASTRDIAAAAGVNAPAIQYYFDGKEGVYLECVKQVVALLWQRMDASVAHAEQVLTDPMADDARLIDSVLGILGAVVALIRDDPQTLAWRAFLDQHQAGLGPSSASTAFDEGFRTRIGGVIRSLISRLTGFGIQDERTVIHSTALFTQGLAFQVQRRGMLTTLGWSGINERETALITEVVLTQARFILEGLARQRSSGATRLS